MRSLDMYRSTDKQVPLFSAAERLPESSAGRLKSSWAQGFREKIYPLLLKSEDMFSDLYRGTTGRPNWSIARKLGVCVLQDMLDLDDQSALDAMAFDARWQYALDLAPEDAYLSRRSLVTFRGLLVERDPEMERMRKVFDRIGQEAIDDLGLSVDSQRMDSTFITSNIRTRGRLDLFHKTLSQFLNWLSSWAPGKRDQLGEPIRTWYLESERGYFSKPKKGELPAKLREVASWLMEVMTTFADDEQVRASEPYLLVGRLLSEHCRVIEVETSSADGDDAPTPGASGSGVSEDSELNHGCEEPAQFEVLEAPVNGGASMQSPFDPDAGYGHKGKGYLVQIAETCNNENRPEIITDFALQPSNGSDHGQTTEALDRLEAVGKAPRTLYADAGYASGAAFAEAEKRNVQLEAPVPTKASSDSLTREHFNFDDDGQVLQCPEGHAPVRQGHRTVGGDSWVPYAYFDAATCRACPMLARCPAHVAPATREAALNISNESRARDEAIVVQRVNSWWDDYAIRTGIEATNSELKRAHGLARLRVRGRPRVLFAVTTKLIACNVKRWLRAATTAGQHPGGADPRPHTSRSWIWVLRTHLEHCSNVVRSWSHSYSSHHGRGASAVVVPCAA